MNLYLRIGKKKTDAGKTEEGEIRKRKGEGAVKVFHRARRKGECGLPTGKKKERQDARGRWGGKKYPRKGDHGH